MLSYNVFCSQMKQFETLINASDITELSPVNTSGMNYTESVLAQMGKYIQTIVNATIIGTSDFNRVIRHSVFALVNILKASGEEYSFSEISPEGLNEDDEDDAEYLNMWQREMTDFSRMTPTMFMGHIISITNQCGHVDFSDREDVAYWCRVQIDAISAFVIMHNIDLLKVFAPQQS